MRTFFGGFRLFRILGIEITINYTWFIIFGLVTWSLAVGVFPSRYPGLRATTYWAMGAVTSILLFASVLLHELAHSWVANRRGLEVRKISLFIFGGVARLSREPPDPRTEFSVAIAGPAVSIGLATMFWFVSRGANTIFPLFAAVFAHLALINLLIVGFNLFPGFPLDGGRLLRAFLWQKMGELRRATFIASNVGRGFAICLIVFGCFTIFTGSLIGGIWFVFIGMFLQQAAQLGYQQTVIQETLSGVKVGELMTSQVVTVPESLSLKTLVEDYFFKYRYTSFPVAQEEKLIGVVNLKDVRETPRAEWASTTVGQVMSTYPLDLILDPQEEAVAALRSMLKRETGKLPVVEGGRLVGIITRRDIMGLLKIKTDFGQ